GRFDGLRPRVHEEDGVEVAGSMAGDECRCVHGRRMGRTPVRPVRELAHLLVGGLGDVLASVADVRTEQAGQTVEVLVSSFVGEVTPVPFYDDRKIIVIPYFAGGAVWKKMLLGTICIIRDRHANPPFELSGSVRRGVPTPALLRWCACHHSRGDLVPNEVPVRCEFFGASRSAEFVDRLAQEADSGFDVLEVDGSEAEAE